MEVINWIIGHGTELVAAAVALLGALTGIFLLVPGEQPEKTFKAIADLLSKLSKK